MYIYPLYRPPSEASSLILQVTLGCSYNKCMFCTSFKHKPFHAREFEEIVNHIKCAKINYPNPRKIFLADANALCLKTETLLKVLSLVKETFPEVERISSYGGPLDILRKSEDELRQIHEAGLEMLYMGVESGSAEVLRFVNKGVTPEEMITAGLKAKKLGYILSCMIISGLGGKKMMDNHAAGSSKVISAINPDFFSLLTLMIDEDSPIKRLVENGEFTLLSPLEVMSEIKMMIEPSTLENCVFRANHASNYYSFRGVLNRDKDSILKEIDNAMKSGRFRPETYRAR